MELLLGTTLIISIILGMVVLGFLITFIVGYISKSNGASKTGKLGLIISLPLLIILLISSAGINSHIKNIAAKKAQTEKLEKKKQKATEKKMNSRFNEASSSFTDKLYTSVTKAEDLAQKEQKAWGAAIDNSNEDFDVDSALTQIEKDNASTIASLTLELENMKDKIDTMSANDTGEYDYAAYEKAYKSAKKLIEFTTSLSGSYNSFGDKYEELDQKAADEYSNLTDY